MATFEVVSQENKKVGSVQLSDAVFGAKTINAGLVHQVITAQRAARRRGTAKTKTRKEVRGGGKKPYKQKGTGNARHGSTRSPIFVGGGAAFGPRPRSHAKGLTKKMSQAALVAALSDRAKAKRLVIVDQFKLEKPRTGAFRKTLEKKFKLKNALIVDDSNQNLELSGRNIPHVKVLRTAGINVYDIVKHDVLVISKPAAQAIDKRLSGKGA